MARLPYVQPDQQADITVQETLAHIVSVRGEVTNLFRMVANCSRVLPPFFALSRYVREQSSLSPRLRELAVLTTAFTLGVHYEIAHHVDAAHKFGITRSEIESLRAARFDLFTGVDRAVIDYAHSVAIRRDIDDAGFQLLASALSNDQLVELAVIVGWYHLVAAIVQPLRVDLEPHLADESGG